MLIYFDDGTGRRPREAYVVECSPSGEYFRVNTEDGLHEWYGHKTIVVLEELTPQTEPVEQP
jgi:hypothetical protein